MTRFFVEMAYKGTNYHGWQIQPNAISIQEKVEDALSKALGSKIDVVGAGRTDTGVHASYYVFHFDVEIEKVIDTLFLTEKLNRILPNDIVIYSIQQVDNQLHARFDAQSRTYFYYVSEKRNPFKVDTLFKPNYKLDFDKMNEAARLLFEYSDFTSFAKLHTDAKTNLCTILTADWRKMDNEWVFVITANRFLRNMVRAIVGTLLEVGKGKLSIEDFRSIIEHKDRAKAGTSAPAHALFLADVTYPINRFSPMHKLTLR